MRKNKIYLSLLICLLFFGCGKETPQPEKPTKPDPTMTKAVSSIKVEESEVVMKPGQKTTIIYTVLPADATNKDVEIVSSNVEVVSLSGKELTALKIGRAVVTLTNKASSVSTKIQVEVISPDATELKLNKSEINLLVGETETLTATIIPEDATETALNWKSNDSNIATISSSGKIEAVAPGETEVVVTTKDDKVSAKAKVIVTAKIVQVESIVLTPTEVSMNVESSATISALVLPANATDRTLEWKSSAPSIVSVDAEGKVKGLKVGSAVITASSKDGRMSAKTTVTVNPIPAGSISLSLMPMVLAIGSTATVTATVLPENTTDKSLVWASSAQDIVSINSKGVIKALKSGSVVITAATKDGKVQGTLNVQVKEDLSHVTGKLSFSLVANQFITIGMQVYMGNMSNKPITIKKVEAYSDGKLAATALSEFTQTIQAQANDQWVIGFTQTKFTSVVGDYPPNWYAKIYFELNGANYAMTIKNTGSSVQQLQQSSIGINPDWDGENTTEIPSK